MCEHINIPGHEGTIIVCGGRGRKKFCHCGRLGAFLCDWKIRTGSGAERLKTCDRPLCKGHATEVAPGKHLCLEHVKSWEAWKRAKYSQGIDPMPHGAPEQQNLFEGPL
jgi:hypothetical protein